MPPPVGPWEAEALEWALEGVKAPEAARRWGCAEKAAAERMRRAKIRAEGRAAPKRPVRGLVWHLEQVDARIEEATAVQHRAVDLLADIAVANKVLLERTAKLEKRLAELSKPQAKTPPPALPPPAEVASAKHDARQPPPSLWVWIVGECRAALGEGGVAQALGVDTTEVRHWHGGRVPSSKHRAELRHLLATLYGRETFASYDDLEDARERVFLYKTQGAEV